MEPGRGLRATATCYRRSTCCMPRDREGRRALVAAISAASILAKTARDAEMRDLDADAIPATASRSHKGYATPEHLAALRAARPLRDPSPQLRAGACARCSQDLPF